MHACGFAGAGEIHIVRAIGGYLVKALAAPLPVEKVGETDGLALPLWRLCVNADHTLRLLKWQRAKQHSIDDAEHRGICANTERKCEHGNRSECRRFAQHPKAIAEVV